MLYLVVENVHWRLLSAACKERQQPLKSNERSGVLASAVLRHCFNVQTSIQRRIQGQIQLPEPFNGNTSLYLVTSHISVPIEYFI